MAQFYRKKNPTTGVDDFYEVGTNKYISPESFRGGGYTEQRQAAPAQEPVRTNPMVDYATSNMGGFQKKLGFLDLIKEAVQRKQGYNKDIRSAKTYWRTQQADPMTFTDERLRLLSPAEQQSIREQRYAAAGANLRSLEEEEKYRETGLSDTVSSIERLQAAKTKDDEEKRIAAERATDSAYESESRRLALMEARREALEAGESAEDAYGSYVSPDGKRVGNKKGGTPAWRNNNPGNIKYSYGNGAISEKAKSLLAAGVNIKKGSPALDGGFFIAFPDVEAGDKAMRELLRSDSYKNLSVDDALMRWSGNGYDSRIVGGKSGIIGRLSDEELEEIITAMKKTESWKEGEYVGGGNKTTHEFWSKGADLKRLSLYTGMSQEDLLANYTDADLDEINRQIKNDPVKKMANMVSQARAAEIGLEDREALETVLELKYVLKEDDATILQFMVEAGYNITEETILALDSIVNPT